MDIEKLREIWGEIVNPAAAHWSADEYPDWIGELEFVAASQSEACTPEQTCLWGYLCFDLNSRPKKAAHSSALGYGNHPCWQLFGHSKLAKSRREFLWQTYQLQLIFYQDNWGWRLRRGWPSKLDFLRAVYLEGLDWHRLEMPWLAGKARPDDAVLGGSGDRTQQPGPYDAVLGGQDGN